MDKTDKSARIEDVRAAAEMLAKQGAGEHWNEDGTLNVAAVEALVDGKVDPQDVAALGIRREVAPPKQEAAPSEPEADPVDAREDGVGDVPNQSPAAEPPVTDETSQDEQLTKAEDHHAAIRAQYDDLCRAKQALDEQIAKVGKELESAQALLNRLSPTISAAEAVKRIQEQTLKSAALRKANLEQAQGALSAAGIKTYPSPLDEVMAKRRKSPEQVAAHAAYIQQRQNETVAGRLGTA